MHCEIKTHWMGVRQPGGARLGCLSNARRTRRCVPR